jgi:hypothetical protein
MLRKTATAIFMSIVLVTTCVALSLKYQDISPEKEKKQKEIERFPIVDFAAPEPKTQQEQNKRKKKTDKYQRFKDTIAPGVTYEQHYHWPEDVSPVPVKQSDVIVVGEVISARASLFEDKSSVYSEFNIRIEEVVKDDGQSPLSVDEAIIVGRPGGRVRYKSGQISFFRLTGLGMPGVGHRYVFFLTYGVEQGDYDILTAYELQGERAIALDRINSKYGAIKAGQGNDAASFLATLRNAANSIK